ncbi:MAG: hypothetical protein AAF376_18270 [Pseudomonadota bacterium]
MVQRLPPIALSVRQPSAWAIIHGGKDIENRSLGSIRAGNMGLGRIAIHAAIGMKQAEYEYLLWRWARDGVRVPRPEDLPRRAIIGSVDVVEIVTESDSPWFGGEAGLRLANPKPCDPIPAPGALGYFKWAAGGDLAPALPWMMGYDRPGGDGATGSCYPISGQASRRRHGNRSAIPSEDHIIGSVASQLTSVFSGKA